MIDGTLGEDWVRGSLAQGSAMAMLMTRRLESLTSATLLIPDMNSESSPVIDERSRGIGTDQADLVADVFLKTLVLGGMRTLVVEDDLARRGDAVLEHEVAFVGDRVLRWTSLEEGTEPGKRLLRSGSSGYPLNAFVCCDSPATLGIQAEHQLTASNQVRVVDSTCAIVVSVYDAEAYLALMTPELERLFG